MQKGEEFLDSNIIRADSVDLDKYLENLEESRYIRPAYIFQQQTKDIADGLDFEKGNTCSWTDEWKIRPAELTVWTGYSGHRKSMMQGAFALEMMKQDQKCVIASLEMPPRKTLYRMIKQWSGATDPNHDIIDQFFEYVSDKLWLFDKVGSVKPKTMLGLTAYCATELGTQHVFIDSLMKCGINDENLDGQKYFIDRLTHIAMATDSHIHLVAHSRKPSEEGEKRPSTKYAVAGSAHITNMADNVVVCWKNENDDRKFDQALIVAKQRHGESEPYVKLNFSGDSLQFTPAGNYVDILDPIKSKKGYKFAQ